VDRVCPIGRSCYMTVMRTGDFVAPEGRSRLAGGRVGWSGSQWRSKSCGSWMRSRGAG
jgi:hypothetical protein